MSMVDVLVVGSGPVAMELALELAIQGVDFRIVDKAATRPTTSRAIYIHSRTLEVLNRHGGIDELLAKSHKVAGNAFWVNRKHYEGFRFVGKAQERPDTRFPGISAITQVDIEDFFEGRLASKGVNVERPVTVQSVVQGDNGATVVLVKSDGSEETVRAKYVVGCDGAHSVVRHSMDVEFHGASYQQHFAVGEVLINWDGFGDKVHIMLGDGLLILLPLSQGKIRIVLSRPAELSSDVDPTLEDFQKALGKMLPEEEKARIHHAVGLTRFHLHYRCSTKYRDGKLFVAGDAAHIHSPVGAQGMNTGIQDSMNLGWKLSRVLNGEMPDSFLDTYHEERWPVGQTLLSQTDQMFTLLSSNTPIFNNIRTLLLPHALPSMGLSDMGLKMMNFFSELDVKYRRSSIVQTAAGFEGPVRGGFRAPDGKIRTVDGKKSWLQDLLRGPGYHVLIFSKMAGDKEVEELERRFLTNKDKPNVAKVHIITSAELQNPRSVIDVDGELHKRYSFDGKPGFVYVRPDGYVERIGYLH